MEHACHPLQPPFQGCIRTEQLRNFKPVIKSYSPEILGNVHLITVGRTLVARIPVANLSSPACTHAIQQARFKVRIHAKKHAHARAHTSHRMRLDA